METQSFTPSIPEGKKVVPSLKSLTLSLVVFSISTGLALYLFEYEFYMPLLVALAVACLLSYVRFRSLRSRLPEPYGKGLVTYSDSEQAQRMGLLLIAGGVLLIVVPIASLAFLPPLYFFSLIFGIVSGLPAVEILYFAGVSMMQRSYSSTFVSMTERTEKDGAEVVVRWLEVVASKRRGKGAGSDGAQGRARNRPSLSPPA